jgi:hypothetical protein
MQACQKLDILDGTQNPIYEGSWKQLPGVEANSIFNRKKLLRKNVFV